MPRSNKLNSSQPRITLYPSRTASKPRVRSRRKSKNHNENWKHDMSSSSDSDLSSCSQFSAESSPNAPQTPGHHSLRHSNTDVPTPSSSISHCITPPNDSMENVSPPPTIASHSNTTRSTLSGKKRKRSRDYQSDFDDTNQYNQNNADLSIGYQLPTPQRHQLSPSSSHVNEGDSIYLIFQEYIEKYRECQPIFDAIHELLDVNDDIQTIEYLCRNTGYLDATVAAIYKPSFVDLGDSWLEAMMRCMDGNETIDIAVLRNWRVIVLHVTDDHGAKQQVVIHEVYDNLGQSILPQYVLSESAFLESIQTFKRGDMVRVNGEEGVYDARIFEITPYDAVRYRLSPFKCLSIVCVDESKHMDIWRRGLFRMSPWEVELDQTNDVIRNSETSGVEEKAMFVDFVKQELMNILPARPSVFERYFKELEDCVTDQSIWKHGVGVSEVQGRLYAIKRKISYEWLCLEEKERNKYDDKWIDIMERIIFLAGPQQQQKLVHSVKGLTFP
eukprot:190887_1